VPEEFRGELDYAISLMAYHTICVGKGEIVISEIEDLVGYDTTAIPTEWEQGTLDERVITEERIAKLNEMLKPT